MLQLYGECLHSNTRSFDKWTDFHHLNTRLDLFGIQIPTVLFFEKFALTKGKMFDHNSVVKVKSSRAVASKFNKN